MENNILEALRLIWVGVILFSFGLAIISFFWGIVDFFVLVRFEGKLKRGIRIWSKSLSEEARKYLATLSGSVVETRIIWGGERKAGFIRVEDGEAIIHYRRRNWSTSWPYIGYIDLSDPEPVLQFRSSLPTHLFLLPFILTGIGIIFVLPLMVFNYYMESTAIENFLKQKVEESNK